MGPNYLQLPINRPRNQVATNQRDGQMVYHVDGADAGTKPHVNYEPSSAHDSPREAAPAGEPHTPFVSGNIVRQAISGRDEFGQAGVRWRSFEEWEREELIHNLASALAPCNEGIQQRMIGYFTQADPDYGRRVAEGIREMKAMMDGMGAMKGGEAKAKEHAGS